MVQVARCTATWNGFSGAPGYTKFSFGNVTDLTTATAALTAMRTFFVGIGGLLRTGWNVTFSPVVEMHDMATGLLVAEFAVTPGPAAVAGSGSATTPWAGGTGAYVTWKTPGIFNGRRVKGRSYLVPLLGVADTDGTLTSSALGQLQSAADGLVNAAGADFVIWSRQFTEPPKPVQINGAINSVSAAIVADKTGVLRSRRD